MTPIDNQQLPLKSDAWWHTTGCRRLKWHCASFTIAPRQIGNIITNFSQSFVFQINNMRETLFSLMHSITHRNRTICLHKKHESSRSLLREYREPPSVGGHPFGLGVYPPRHEHEKQRDFAINTTTAPVIAKQQRPDSLAHIDLTPTSCTRHDTLSTAGRSRQVYSTKRLTDPATAISIPFFV